MNIFKEEPEDINMTYTVTVTYTVSTYGKSRLDCQCMIEDMSVEQIQKEGTVQDIEIGDGEVY